MPGGAFHTGSTTWSGGWTILTVILLARQRTRSLGRALGVLVTLPAVATLPAFLEFERAAAPMIVLVTLPISRYLDDKERDRRWEGTTARRRRLSVD